MIWEENPTKKRDNSPPPFDDLCDFISEILDDHYDCVVCLERSGLALYDDLLENCFSSSQKAVPHISERAIPIQDLQNKKVLVFDDSAKTGKNFLDAKKAIQKRGASKIDTVCYFKLNNIALSDIIACHNVSLSKWITYREQLSDYFNQRLVPFDADHITIRGRFENDVSREDFEKTLLGLGRSYQIKPIGKEQIGVYKYAITDIDFLDWKSLGLPGYVQDMSTWKLRINFNGKNEFCIFPLAFPEIKHGGNPGEHNFPWCFCNKYLNKSWKTTYENPEWFLACCCIIFHSSTELLSNFLRHWSKNLAKMNKNFSIDSPQYCEAQHLFGDQKITDHLLARLSDK